MSETDPIQKFGKAVEEKQSPKKDEPEREIWRGVYSAKGMFGTIVAAAVVTVAAIVAISMIEILHNTSTALWSGVLILVLLWTWILGLMSYRKLAKSYELTSQRLKHRDGILFRTVNRIELLDIDDVNYTQGPIELLLNVGNITISSSDASHPKLILQGIADVRKVADLIDDARRTERRRRGLHIESI